MGVLDRVFGVDAANAEKCEHEQRDRDQHTTADSCGGHPLTEEERREDNVPYELSSFSVRCKGLE